MGKPAKPKQRWTLDQFENRLAHMRLTRPMADALRLHLVSGTTVTVSTESTGVSQSAFYRSLKAMEQPPAERLYKTVSVRVPVAHLRDFNDLIQPVLAYWEGEELEHPAPAIPDSIPTVGIASQTEGQP